MSTRICIAVLLNSAIATLPLLAQKPADAPAIFAKDNLVAWCIVPFDAKNRGPAERADIKREIADLARQRDAYVADKKAEAASAAPSMSDALTQAVKKQAEIKNFVFEE